jgi:phenylpropionate dioxygenase-like ring-hydroxylating dioxygenase large terminal subunit
MSRFPFPDFPEGWFQVASSADLESGAVLPLHYFGQQLVAWRDRDRVAHVMDAFCPHMGAHIGYGGQVEGCDLVCPFHGWHFDPDGRNVDIPYRDNVNRGARLRPWPTTEVAGMVLVWHSPVEADPSWDPPQVPEAYDPAFLRHAPEDARWSIRTHPQEIAENTVDIAHFKFVHGVTGFGELAVVEDGPMFRTVAEVSFVTPRGDVAGAVESELWGLGIDVVRHRGLGSAASVLTLTPVDGDVVDARYTFCSPVDADTGEISRLGWGFVRDFMKQITQDIPIWEHKIYRPRPSLAKGEGPIMQFRRWAERYYPEPQLADARTSTGGRP